LPAQTVYYATNRRPTGKESAPTGYSGKPSDDGIENLRVGEVVFSVTRTEVDQHLRRTSSLGTGDGNRLAAYYKRRLKGARINQYPEKLVGSKDEPLPQDEQKLGSRKLFEELRSAMKNETDVLVYVHGYSVDWRSAVSTAAALQTMLNRRPGRKVMVLLFTWPSDGQKLPWTSYRSDRKDAADSGLALGRGLLKLRDYLGGLAPADYCGQNLHVLCHSMGNWVLQNALRRVIDFGGPRPLPRILDNVFLCSPDVDDEVFDLHPGDGGRSGQMLPLLELAKTVSIYHNRGDLALVVSDTTKGNANRLGTNGAAHPQTLHVRVHQIDCSEQVEGLVEHSYYMVGRVNDDIRQSIDDEPQGSDARSRRQGAFENTWVLG
jgi:esterase/lipase superfamily enzyme